MTADTTPVALGGAELSIADLRRIADGAAQVVIGDAERLRRSWLVARKLAQPVYGRTTGVGGNCGEAVADPDEHGMRLLRSHASAIGDPVPEREVRAMLAVRVNQVLRGGSGIQPAIAEAMVAALNSGAHPQVHEHGSVGTGDLGPLAEAGLALAGEGRWNGPPPPPVVFRAGDALALISSNALTIGQAASAVAAIRTLLDASARVTALTLRAVGGSTEPFAPEVHRNRPHAGSTQVAADVLALLGGEVAPGRRIQDAFGLRCFPQVHGPALEAAADAESVLTVEINSAAENPLITPGGAVHHGGFHTAQPALAMDRLRLAVLATAQLSAARLSMLDEPDRTGLRPFLAAGPQGSSGVMLLEHGAASALAELRAAAFPVTLGNAVLSRAAEDHAGFASQAARQTKRAADAYRLVLACELVAAVRAHRMLGTSLDAPVRTFCERACRRLDPDLRDRPLSADVAIAATLLDEVI
ncbi:aromatic amino acid lyase [Saccharopolyspora indica]|uniref:aromatic amino acid ammonia-lyase n=1 Tax=Saccharopolyspora indica TaxID=1229659 RepID=UPI0022EA7914|nr:aromatic amino acid ammonia-lyase [Saccharopolyspora indica]MDA3645717.1 aromatic amino acid lyase [Saccharopolyspora indica]